MTQAFTRKELESPRILADLLMAHVTGCDRLKLYVDPDRPASPLERETLRDLVGRALKHEPVQYLTGEAFFFGMQFQVDRRVLIPRPSTETIVEHVLQHHRARHGPSGQEGPTTLIADICTGSGCIAISLLKHLQSARAVACDISADALEVCRINARRHEVIDRLELLQGDVLSPLFESPSVYGEGSLDYLVSNPPYIPDDEWAAVEPNVKDHEPHLALRGGIDGLDFVRTIAAAGPRFLKVGGLLMIEVAAARAAQAAALLAASDLMQNVRIAKDFEGLDRVVIGQRRA